MFALWLVAGCDDGTVIGPDASATGGSGGGSGGQVAVGGAEEGGRLQGITLAHNRERAMNDIPPLRWDARLAGVAQSWADQLAARGCGLQHSSSGYGENIFAIFGADATPDQVVASWVSEKAAYVRSGGSCGLGCGHYTQVVWSRSERLGCGMAECGSTEVWVCNYDPPGNFIGQSPF